MERCIEEVSPHYKWSNKVNKSLILLLATAQHLFGVAAVILFVYLLNLSNKNPTVNVWLGPVILVAISGLFKLARKGVGAKRPEK